MYVQFTFCVYGDSTVFTAMLNFVKVLKQLKQKSLPVFADEGVFRIMLDIYLKCPDTFSDLVPMLGGFHWLNASTGVLEST